MLKIHKISFGNNLSEIDFSGLDLKEVPLIGFCFDEKSRGHFRGTVLGHDTLWETGHRMMISSLSWSPTWKQFISASHDCTMRIWDRNGNSRIFSEQTPHKVYIRAVQWCPNNENLLVSPGDDQEIVLWQRVDVIWRYKVIAQCSSWVCSLAWSPNGKSVACGCNASELFSVSLVGEKKEFASQHEKAIRTIRFYKDGRLISGSEDGILCVWAAGEYGRPQIKIHLSAEVVSTQLVNHGKMLAVFTKRAAYIIYAINPRASLLLTVSYGSAGDVS